MSLLALIGLLSFAAPSYAQQPAAPAGAPPTAGDQSDEQQAVPNTAPPGALGGTSTNDKTFVLGIGDVLEVAMVGGGDFKTSARVTADGTVLLPLLGALQAKGRTPFDLAEDVRTRLQKGGFYSNPVIRVELMGVASRYVTVLGNVGAPGLLPLDRDYHLSEVLARVGGKRGAAADYVVLTHRDGKSDRYPIDKLATGSDKDDPLVAAGDKLFVPTAENEVFYISGQVHSPGTYPVTNNLTMRMAIARGGGVTEMGNENKIKVVRNGATLKGVKQEDKVQPGDVITIGERLF